MTITCERPPSIPWEGTLPTLAELLGTGSWRRDAACIDEDPELFAPHPDGERKLAVPPPRAHEAARICARCPVRARCAASADERREVGVWGGAWRYRNSRDGYRAAVIPTAPTCHCGGDEIGHTEHEEN